MKHFLMLILALFLSVSTCQKKINDTIFESRMISIEDTLSRHQLDSTFIADTLSFNIEDDWILSQVLSEDKKELLYKYVYIKSLTDLQIINGGQTTASIANAVLQDKRDVSDIMVPMKLSIVDNDLAEEMIPVISRCANSQNKVDEADFFSNHPYHIRIEDFSRRIYAPATNGNQYQTIWFYERARGQHTQEQMKLTKAERKKFLLKNPKSQLIKKVDWAKYINTYNLINYYYIIIF